MGREEFLARYGFGHAYRYYLSHEEKLYDAKAILGVAYGYQFPERGVLKSADFASSERAVKRTLGRLGFLVETKESLDDTSNYWTFVGNPSYYRVDDAVNEQETWYWSSQGSRVRKGDRGLIWRTMGRDKHRGIISLVEVLSDPVVMGPDDNDPYVVAPEHRRGEEARVEVRFVHPPNLPLWAGMPEIDALELSVTKAQGGTVFHVTPKQWECVLELAGGWPMEVNGVMDLRDFLSKVAAEYDRLAPMDAPTQVLLKAADDHLHHLVPPKYQIRGSGGVGNATSTPWVGIFDPKETTSPQHGVYVVYIFSADLKSVTLTLNQGIDELRDMGRAAARQELKARAETIRSRLPREMLTDLSAEIDLAVPPGVYKENQASYEAANIAAKRYDCAHLPMEADLRADLTMFLDLYQRAIADYQTTGAKGPEGLAADLYVPAAFLNQLIALLEEKKQVVLYGPPGTGKTFIARALIRHLVPQEDLRETVQFHPSYGYEDFIQGYRPYTDESGQLTYELRDGPLVTLANRAHQAPDQRGILLIDEINRGNVPRILGECLYLLEYRNDSVRLLYTHGTGQRFSMPENLLIIGTMNISDRSIGLIDVALRRRFHFIPLFPSDAYDPKSFEPRDPVRDPLAGILWRWIDDNKPEMLHVARMVDALNRKIRERFGAHLQIGHSFFMRTDLSNEMLERVWQYDVLPTLQDQLFGREKEIQSFAFEKLGDGALEDNPPAGAQENGEIEPEQD